MAQRIWIRGVPGRLTRIERGGPFVPVDEWTMASMSATVQRKAARGSLEVSYTDPTAKKPKSVSAKPAEPPKHEKEVSA